MPDPCELDEARQLIRWAAQTLTRTERAALSAWLREIPACSAAEKYGLSRGAFWMAKQSALPKLRRRLAAARIERVADVLTC